MSDTTIIKEFLYHNNYFVKDEDLTLHLYSNPDYPTLKAISDTFDYFDIQNVSANVPKEALSQLPESFLALIEIDEKPEIVFIKKKDKKIIIKGLSINKSVTFEEFNAIWTGTITAVEKNTKKPVNKNKEILILAVAVVLLLTGLEFYSGTISSLFYNVLSLIGILISVLIIREESGIKNTTVSKVCSSINSKGGCSKVISSSNAKLFGFLSLSDSCATLFISQLLITNFLGFDVGFLFALGILALPILLYSLYSQAFVLKQWCILCIAISGLVLAQFSLVSYVGSFSVGTFSFPYYMKAILIMIVVYIAIKYLKSFFMEIVGLKNTELNFLKFKRNQKLFNILLNENKLEDNASLPIPKEISFGAKNFLLEINAVTNPLCGFCSKSFNVYYKLLQTHSDKIKINFIFNIPYGDTEHPSTKIATAFIKKYVENKDAALKILHEWFNNRDIDHWIGKYARENVENTEIAQLLIRHTDWCIANSINYTPATLLDRNFYPAMYDIEDLYLLVDEIVLEKETENQKNSTAEASI